MRLTALAHRYLSDAIRPGDLAIDATMGNGHDTCFLAQQVGENGRVIAFDVQQAALDATSDRLAKMGCAERVTLVHAGHETLATHLPASNSGTVAGVTFNLGYLPGSDKRLTTTPATTIQALRQALGALRIGGVVTLLVYVGHTTGANEYQVVQNWLSQNIGPEFELATHRGEADHSPILYAIKRKTKFNQAGVATGK